MIFFIGRRSSSAQFAPYFSVITASPERRSGIQHGPARIAGSSWRPGLHPMLDATLTEADPGLRDPALTVHIHVHTATDIGGLPEFRTDHVHIPLGVRRPTFGGVIPHPPVIPRFHEHIKGVRRGPLPGIPACAGRRRMSRPNSCGSGRWCPRRG
jgi:hypothetical protein